MKFIVEQEIEIANVKPAYVHVYDYYDKGKIIFIFSYIFKVFHDNLRSI